MHQKHPKTIFLLDNGLFNHNLLTLSDAYMCQ